MSSYTRDTGLYHLAAAMGIPATVVSAHQPGRIILPRQDAARVRLEVLAKAMRRQGLPQIRLHRAGLRNLAPSRLCYPVDGHLRTARCAGMRRTRCW